jgi:hypothetical protein
MQRKDVRTQQEGSYLQATEASGETKPALTLEFQPPELEKTSFCVYHTVCHAVLYCDIPRKMIQATPRVLMREMQKKIIHTECEDGTIWDLNLLTL